MERVQYILKNKSSLLAYIPWRTFNIHGTFTLIQQKVLYKLNLYNVIIKQLILSEQIQFAFHITSDTGLVSSLTDTPNFSF